MAGKTENPADGKKKFTELIDEVSKEGISYLNTNVSVLFRDLLRIYALDGAVGLLAFGIAVAIAWPVITTLTAGDTAGVFSGANLRYLLLAGLVIAVGSIAATVIHSVAFNAVAERANGRAIRIFDQIRANAGRMITLAVVLVAIAAVVFSPGVIVFFLGGFPLIISAIGLLLLSFIAWKVLKFFFQFAIWEVAVNGRGAVEGLKLSYGMVMKGNILKTLGFDILLFLVVAAIATIFGVVNSFVRIFLGLGTAGVVIYFALLVIIGIIEAAVIWTLLLPFTYSFWKKLVD